MTFLGRALVLIAFALALLPIPARAQSVADFYHGKSIDLDIGYSVGGGYDLYARFIARRLGGHIPGNPTIVPKNMEGAGSLRLANYLYAAAPNDGTVIGATSRGAAFDPLLGETGARFDASKFSWIGSANNEVSVCVASARSGITKFDELFDKPLTIGSTGAADDTYQFPALVNAVLGTEFKIVTGYPGGNDVSLALERGEV
jgi:tripartite-type tricarboxylate transporter receptor subunit TctC